MRPLSPHLLRVLGSWRRTIDEVAVLGRCSQRYLAERMRETPELREAWEQGPHKLKASPPQHG